MCTNVLISCDKDFKNIIIKDILDFLPLRGCTGIAFVPYSGDTEIICCRTSED